MSDLDKAIRDRLAVVRGHMTMHRAAQIDDSVDPLFNDAGELGKAVVDLLDWANGLEKDFEGKPSNVGKAFADQVRTVLADSLGVSGEDRSEHPAPREYRAGDTEPPVGTKLTGGGFTWTRHGRSWQTPEGGVLNWAQLTEFCPRLSEVVSPEGTS